jgi:copper homeostasis protein
MSMTFHRAFDMTRDPFESLETLVELEVDRVLTSGQHENVLEGAELVRRLVEQADGRIGILPGAGIREDNIGQLISETGVSEVHFTAMVNRESGMLHRNPLPRMGGANVPGEFELSPTDPERVRAMVKAAQGGYRERV